MKKRFICENVQDKVLKYIYIYKMLLSITKPFPNIKLISQYLYCHY